MNKQVPSDNVIDEIIKDNKLHRFASELQYTDDQTRKAQINEILVFLQGVSAIKTQSPQSKRNKMFSDYHNKAILQSWNKLKKSQRNERMKCYLTELVKDEDNRNDIIKQVCELIDEGKLKGTKEVIYNKEKGEIISVPRIMMDPKLKKYVLVKKAK